MNERNDGGLDLSWVSGGLALGGKFSVYDVERLALDLGIRRIIDLRAESRDDVGLLSRYQLGFLHIPTPDLHPIPLDPLTKGVLWAREGLGRNERVLAHCEHGIGRSALFAACVLFAEGASLSEALSGIKKARTKVSPSPAQLEQLLEWARRWSGFEGVPPPGESWHDLASIVYPSYP